MCNHNKNSPWYKYGLSFGFPNVSWTEKVNDSWLATPFNTISNVFYFISAYFCSNNPLISTSLCLVGLSSGLYHCSVIYPFQLMDLYSMKILFSVMIYQQLKIKFEYFYLILFLNTLYFYLLVKYNKKIQYSSVLNILFLITTINNFNLYSILSLISFLIGIVNSYIDLKYNFIYGHSFWHLFSALSVYFWNIGLSINNNLITFNG